MGSQNNDNLKRSAFSSMIWKFAERVCARLVSLAVSIVLARMLMPDDYSVVGIVAIFFAFCDVFVSGGLNAALIQKKDAAIEDYSTVLYMNLMVALTLYLLMFFCAPMIAALYEKPQLVALIRVMGLTFFANGLKSVLSAYISSSLDFRKFFLSTIVGTVLSAAVGIFMAYKGMGAWALVGQQMTNTIVDTMILYWSTRMRIVRVFSVERIRSLFGYGWKIMLSSVVSVAYDQISPLIVGLRFTPADLAYYNKGKSFPGLINDTVSDTLAAVLFPVMSKVQDNKEDVLNITRRYVKTASYVIFPLMAGMFAVSENFVRFLLTDKWLMATPYIQIFAVSYMFNLIQVGNLQAIKAIGRSDITLVMEVLKKSIYFAIIAGFVFFANNPELFAFSSICCTAVATLINTAPNRKLLNYSYRWQIADILPNLLMSVVMGAAVMWLGTLPCAAGLLLLLQIAAGVLIYLALSILTRNESFRYLLQFILQTLKRG